MKNLTHSLPVTNGATASPRGNLQGENNILHLAIDILSCISWQILIETSLAGLHSLCHATDAMWLERTCLMREHAWEYAPDHPSSECSKITAGHFSPEKKACWQRHLGRFHTRFERLFQQETRDAVWLSDCYNAHELASMARLKKYLRHQGVNDILCFQTYHADPGNAAVVIIGMKSCRHDALHKSQLNMLMQKIRIAGKRIARTTGQKNVTNALSRLRSNPQNTGICTVSSRGSKLWETDKVASHLIRSIGGYTDQHGLQMPPAMSHWVQQQLQDHTRIIPRSQCHEKQFASCEGSWVSARLFIGHSGQGGLLTLTQHHDENSIRHQGRLSHGLTPREIDVYHSLSAGLPTQEIADALSISKRTVDKHLQNIYHKLGVRNRAAAIAANNQTPAKAS